jgi:ankyrin repeat protein
MNCFVITLIMSLFVLSAYVSGGVSEEKIPPLINAVLTSNYSVAEKIIQSNKQVDIKYGGSTALIFAVTPVCKLPFVKLLLQGGANPNSRQVDTNTTPLLEALATGNLECIDTLLVHDGDITLSDLNGTGAAYRAVESGSLELVERVASMGVDIDLSRNDGVSPLMYAARAGKKDIVRFLLENGSLECRRNSRGLTAKNFAELSKDSEIFRLFTINCDI